MGPRFCTREKFPVKWEEHPLEDPLDGVISLRVIDAATGEPVANGDYNIWSPNGSGAGLFERGAIEERDCCIGSHRYSIRSDVHVPKTAQAEILLSQKKIQLTVRLKRATKLVIESVHPTGSGARAGFLAGDAIRTYNGQKIRSLADLRKAVRAARGRSEVEVAIAIVRNGAVLEMQVPTEPLGIGVVNAR